MVHIQVSLVLMYHPVCLTSVCFSLELVLSRWYFQLIFLWALLWSYTPLMGPFSVGHSLLCFQSLVSRFICFGWAKEFRDISRTLDTERMQQEEDKAHEDEESLMGEHTSSLGWGLCCRLILHLASLCPLAGKTAYSPSFYSLRAGQLGFWYELHLE